MPNRQNLLLSAFVSVSIFTALNVTLTRAAPFMVVGNDEKMLWDDDGKPILSAPGKDSVLTLDPPIWKTRRLSPTCRSRTQWWGPPVNVAIDPTNSIALVADLIDAVKDGDKSQNSAGQQSLCHRPESKPAQARQHRHGW